MISDAELAARETASSRTARLAVTNSDGDEGQRVTQI